MPALPVPELEDVLPDPVVTPPNIQLQRNPELADLAGLPLAGLSPQGIVSISDPLTMKEAAAVPSLEATVIAVMAQVLADSLANRSHSTGAEPPLQPLLPNPHPNLNADPALQPEALLEDLKKLEITIQREALKPAKFEPKPEAPEQALITTDPIASIQQSQLPLRVIAIQKVSPDAKLSERKNQDQASIDDSQDATTPTATLHVAEPPRRFDPVEQLRAPQLIEIPHVPKLPVVRTVSMEVGDSQSQVIVRIEDRAGGMNLHFGTGSELLHRTIESSIDSLIHALRQEKIDVSNIEVSRKSPIEKVRRMKEAH